MMFVISSASLKRGAISSSRNPAMPQPIRVTRNVSRLCSLAKQMNSSTYGLMVTTPPCMVGIAYVWPCRPTPSPHTAPNRSKANRAAPPPCAPARLLPKTNISSDFKESMATGVYFWRYEPLAIWFLTMFELSVYTYRVEKWNISQQSTKREIWGDFIKTCNYLFSLHYLIQLRILS